jgi:haloacetate dehalogenase
LLPWWADPATPSSATTPLDTWKTWATDVRGSPVDSGHFLTEENPDATARMLREFLVAA